MRSVFVPVLLLLLGLFQATVAQARSDELIQREIEDRIAASEPLNDAGIKVHVEERLVVLTGQVRIYEQKLVSERIAWTTTGVFEVDNEIRVRPKVPLSDTEIERKVMGIVMRNDRFRAAGVTVTAREGKVLLRGNFLGFSDPTALKHKVAEIEGVIGIEMQAVFLAQVGTQ